MLTSNQGEENIKSSKRRRTNKKENTEEATENGKKTKSPVRRCGSGRTGGKKNRTAKKEPKSTTSEQTEHVASEQLSNMEHFSAPQSTQVPSKMVPASERPENLTVKLSLQSTTNEDNYDEE